MRALHHLLLVCGFLLSAPALAQEETPTSEKTPDIHYVPTPQQLVDVMLQMAEVKKGDLVYDLGCGDGRLVIRAAKNHGARGIGIDIDPVRIEEAQKNAAGAKVQDRVEFRLADLFESDFRNATVITLYLLDSLNERLRPHIFAQVKPGTRVVSHAFRMGEWEPDADRAVKINGSVYNAFFWVVPANISGRWKLSGARGNKDLPEVVTIDQKFQRFTIRDEATGESLGEGSLRGNEFVLTTNSAGDKPATSFTGTVRDNRISAISANKSRRWTADREAGTEKPLEPTPTAVSAVSEE